MIKVKKRRVLLLPGDGIGPEVIAEVKKVINWFNDKKSLDFEIDEDLAGGCSYDKHGTPITDEVFYKALESAVVMLGAVGGPKWDNVDFSKISASLSRSKEYFSAIAKLKIEAIGFAIPLPAISGADPCIGSYIALISPSLFFAPKDADGKRPKDPVNIEAWSDNISPNKLSVTITSNCFGFLKSCIAQLSANI